MTAFDILFNPLRSEHPFGKYDYQLTNFMAFRGLVTT